MKFIGKIFSKKETTIISLLSNRLSFNTVETKEKMNCHVTLHVFELKNRHNTNLIEIAPTNFYMYY